MTDQEMKLVAGTPPEARSALSPPSFEWQTDHCVMTASPPGARIRCELEHSGDVEVQARSRVTIRTETGDHIANVTVHVPHGEDHSEETRQLAEAIYWSWWRAQQPLKLSVPAGSALEKIGCLEGNLALRVVEEDLYAIFGWLKDAQRDAERLRGEATYWREQQASAAERHRAEVVAHTKTKETAHAVSARQVVQAENKKLREALEWAGSHLKGNSQDGTARGCVHCAMLARNGEGKHCPVHAALKSSEAES